MWFGEYYHDKQNIGVYLIVLICGPDYVSSYVARGHGVKKS